MDENHFFLRGNGASIHRIYDKLKHTGWTINEIFLSVLFIKRKQFLVEMNLIIYFLKHMLM